MVTFIVALLALVLGYVIYGRYIACLFGYSSSRVTPASRLADGVDYIPMKPWRIFTVQFLNIAGLGPIFGAILGAAYGPISYLWIVLGCIFMGAAHDYFSGMISLRNDGMSIPDVVSRYMGRRFKVLMVVFLFVLLLLVGSSFISAPADLLASLTDWDRSLWLYLIFGYYILATLLPVDKIIGKIYPFFGAVLLFMAAAIMVYLFVHGMDGSLHLVELTGETFRNYHADPDVNIALPMMFIVISCGAISGFHATQSPMMARCLTDEKYGRPCFYGAMIAEGVVALVWATAAMAFFGGPEGLNASGMSPAVIVDKICSSWLGRIGAAVAIIGVVVCPLTSGDTAFRSLRLILADALKINQLPMKNRLVIVIPLFLIAFGLCFVEFGILWRYVGLFNQILATIFLWTVAVYLASERKTHLPMSLPAAFMTYICVAYFMIAPYSSGGLALSQILGHSVAVAVALILFVLFAVISKKKNRLGYSYITGSLR